MPSPNKTIDIVNERLAQMGLSPPGDALYVNSARSFAGTGSSKGYTPSNPLSTLASAVSRAATIASGSDRDNGITIFVMPGHSETITSAVTVATAGVSIVGLGNTRNRPLFTCGGAIDMISITGANVKISNLRFAASTAAATARIDMGAADCIVENCEFLCGANDLETITIPDAGDRAIIRNCEFRITANGPDSGIRIESASTDGVMIESCWADGGSATNQWDDAFVYSSVACTNTRFKGNVSTTFGTAIDMASASFVHELTDGSVVVNRATAALPQTTTADIFVITGYVDLLNLCGVVTTVIQTQANNTKLQHDPSGTGSNTDLCANLDITADAVGTVYSIVGVPATALKSTALWQVLPADNIPAPGIVLGPGSIALVCAASNTGSVRWICRYRPVAGGMVRAA